MAQGNTAKKRPSMQDVARLAGVSRTTVSFVLNNKSDSNIPEATQARVLAAVEELGYRPNLLARGLRSQKTRTIGFISDEVASTPYAGQIIQGAQELAWENNYLLLLINTGGNRELKQTAVDTLLSRQVDGIIYATMYHRPVNPPLQIREKPTVLLDCYVEDRSLPSVVPDDARGGFDATTHLIEKGHTRIGFINDQSGVVAQFQRLEGYQKALKEHGLPFEPSLVVSGPSIAAGGYQGMQQLLAHPHPPTAVFCFNDRMAMGAYDAIRKEGLSIPDDIAVVGFDNHEIIAAHIHPPLTTLELPHYEMGQWAVNHLLHIMRQTSESEELNIQKTLPCPLIVRSSA